MTRRHDIDWLRAIAIGLLLVYHTVIAFQPWGFMLGFITTDKPLPSLWPPMTIINIWRIPLLFYISGMGVCFASKTRTWKQVLAERSRRILIPFVFGVFIIAPLQSMLVQSFYRQSITYVPGPGHLWFLGNIFAYLVLLLPVFTLLKGRFKARTAVLSRLFSTPLLLVLVVAAFVIETRCCTPSIYELYALTWHGFFLGLLAFFFGYCFMLAGNPFWGMLLNWRWLFLVLALGLYVHRLLQFPAILPDTWLACESCCWIFAVFAFGYRYLRRPGRALPYLSQAAYPIYIIHMLFLHLACRMILPLELSGWMKFVFVLMLTITGCFASYELVIRRLRLLRMLFGLSAAGKRPAMDAPGIAEARTVS
jgi:peptidoglycan/LPS O-acetylase OafA/YrhL